MWPSEQPSNAADDSAPAESAEVFVRLASGERIAVGSFDGQAAAEARAYELIAALGGRREWPQVDGRMIRPEIVVSIDVERLDA